MLSSATESAEKTLCHALLTPIRENVRSSVYPLTVTGNRAQQFRRGTRDPAPYDASEFVIAAAQPLRLALRNFSSSSAVPPDEEQGRFPDLALVGHHRRSHHKRKTSKSARVPEMVPHDGPRVRTLSNI